MNDVEVQSICDYLEECLFEPSINWSPEQFAERSYSRWAVSEILDRVRGNPEVPIVSTVEVFMAEMTYFAHISPYGLPMLAGWLVAKLHVLRYMLRDWIYG